MIMRFGAPESNRSKTVRIRNFGGGMVLQDCPGDPANGQLTACENLDYRDGLLKTRRALRALPEDLLFDASDYPNMRVEHRMGETEIQAEGETCRVLFTTVSDDFSVTMIFVHFLGASGKKIQAGQFIFQRVSDDSFYLPENLLIFSGKPQSGSGIYAFVTKRDQYHVANTDQQMYELSADYRTWAPINEFYEPVVLINGRGTRYEESKRESYAFTAAPKILESKNLLNGRFTAYYTSDAHSSSFRLPFSDLSADMVVCRVYTAPDQFVEWRIYGGQNSTTARFFSADIIAHVDRGKGILYFTDTNNSDFAIDIFTKYHENNIRITASKQNPEDLFAILSCTHCAAFGSKLVFAGGKDRNRLFCVSRENPLYFPAASAANIGDNTPVTAMIGIKSGVLAFKKDAAYAVQIQAGKAFNSYSLVPDNDAVFYENDSFSYVQAAGKIGCMFPCTLTLCGETPVWLGEDGAVYAYQAAAGKTVLLAEADPAFAIPVQEDAVFAVSNEKRYCLLWGDKAIIIENERGLTLNGKDVRRFHYCFTGNDVLGGVFANGVLRLICTDNGELLYSVQPVEGDTDAYLTRENGVTVAKEVPILSRAETCRFALGLPHTDKWIDSITLALACEGTLAVSLNGRASEQLHLRSSAYGCALKAVKILPHMHATDSLCFGFYSDRPFSVGEITVHYRENNK